MKFPAVISANALKDLHCVDWEDTGLRLGAATTVRSFLGTLQQGLDQLPGQPATEYQFNTHIRIFWLFYCYNIVLHTHEYANRE